MSKYRIFSLDETSGQWQDLKWVEAVNQKKAIREVADGNEGTYFVVPARSFNLYRAGQTERVVTRSLKPVEAPE